MLATPLQPPSLSCFDQSVIFAPESNQKLGKFPEVCMSIRSETLHFGTEAQGTFGLPELLKHAS